MRSLIVIVLLALVGQAPCGVVTDLLSDLESHASDKESMSHSTTNSSDVIDMMTDNLVHKLSDQVLKLPLFQLTLPRITARSTSGGPSLAKPEIVASSRLPASHYRWAKLGTQNFGTFSGHVHQKSRHTEIARAEGLSSNEFPQDRSEEAKKVLWMLREGNNRYINPSRKRDDSFMQDYMLQDEWNKDQLVHALLVMCPTVFARGSDIFQMEGNFFVRTIQSFAEVAQPYDSLVGSLEYMLSETSPPVIVVMGNSHNYPIRAAVYRALRENHFDEQLPQPKSFGSFKEDETTLVSLVLPAAMDAVRQQPHGSVRRLCEIAGTLNVFNTIETLIRSSSLVRDRIKAGALQIHGAYMDQRSGKVTFLGEHPLKEDICNTARRDLGKFVRTAGTDSVPADEAYSRLFAGNRRFASDRSGIDKDLLGVKRLQQLATHGQNPLAVLLGCSDSRAPTDSVFDAQPGDVFVIRNAGNTCESPKLGIGCSTIGSAEYAVGHLGTRLLVVMGHTSCGAVTAAVKKVLEEKANPAQIGERNTITNMLENMHSAAWRAIDLASDFKEQVQLAANLSIFDTIAKLITGSDIIGGAVARGELEIHGAMYNITTGAVKWLGSHPDLEKLLDKKMPVHHWKETTHVSGQFTLDYFGGFMGHDGTVILKKEPRHDTAVWSETVINLKKGNARFLRGETIHQDQTTFVRQDANAKPSTLILAEADFSVTVRSLFDAEPREMLVQKTIGNPVASTGKSTMIASVEYAVVTFAPKLILILGQSDSEIVKLALRYISGQIVDDFPNSVGTIISRLAVPAARAVRDVEKGGKDTSAGEKSRLQRMAVELNALYAIENLLTNSEVVRYAVRTGQLEIQAAVLNDRSLEVDFLGPHPMQNEILQLDGDSPAPATAALTRVPPPPMELSPKQRAFLDSKRKEVRETRVQAELSSEQRAFLERKRAETRKREQIASST